MANRLRNETSPYLLQHRDNPVDWYPWGDEALARARDEDLPILLSIGYSSCHWCHVMAHESFEDEETARLMNERFVNVKVDREERPDIDSIYMSAVQQMTGHGGWPMTVFLTPAGVPFYGGTYFPPAPRHGLPSFRQILEGVSQAYTRRREEVEESAGEMLAALRRTISFREPETRIDEGILSAATSALTKRFDRERGGFGGAPKFPQPMLLEFLLREWHRTGAPGALEMVRSTLTAMARGGMYDQVGGGFHRYSVDARWLVPHFEKMLYDNALLARAYLHGYQATGDGEMRRVVEEVIGWALREMRAPEGGFHSALDADSEGEEGRFYVWRAEEVDGVLGAEDGPIFRSYYDITASGNWEGRSIPRVVRSVEEAAGERGMPGEELTELLERGRQRLYEHRARRVWPGLDDKIITSWNAMMIQSLAEAGRVLQRREWVEAAVAAAEFLLGTLRDEEGRLMRTYRAGTARIPAFLEDHALLCSACMALYEATFETRWISEARALADRMLAGFRDAGQGIFYDTEAGAEALVVRPRDYFDNATPSGSSAAVTALLRLTSFTGENGYEAAAVQTMESMARLVERMPEGFGELLSAMEYHLAPPRELAIVGSPEEAETRALLERVSSRYLPDLVLALRDPRLSDPTADDVPLLAGRDLVDGRPAAYLCRRFTCQRPVTDPDALEAELGGRQP